MNDQIEKLITHISETYGPTVSAESIAIVLRSRLPEIIGGKWIKTEDKVPGRGWEVLAWYESDYRTGKPLIAVCWIDRKGRFFTERNPDLPEDPAYWQPLPAPPTEGEKP